MTAPRVDPSYIANLIASGKITVAPSQAVQSTGLPGRPANVVRTARLDKERERQRLKRVAFASQGLTSFGTKRKRKVYEPRATMSAAQLAEVKWMDSLKHTLKVIGKEEMYARAEWHERLADRLKRILAGEFDGDKKGLTYRKTERKRRANKPRAGMTEDQKREAHRVCIELHKLLCNGRRATARRVKWHLELAGRMKRVIELGEQRGRA